MKKSNSRKILAGSGVLLTASSLVGAQSAVNSKAIFNISDWWLYIYIMKLIFGKEWLMSKVEDELKKKFPLFPMNVKGLELENGRCYEIGPYNGGSNFSLLVKVVLNNEGSGFEVFSGEKSLYRCDSMNSENLGNLTEVLENEFLNCEKNIKNKAILEIRKKISEKFSNATFAEVLDKNDYYVVTFNFSDKIKVPLQLELRFKSYYLPSIKEIGTVESLEVVSLFSLGGPYSLNDEGLKFMVNDMDKWYTGVSLDLDKLNGLVEKYQFKEPVCDQDGNLTFLPKKGLNIEVQKNDHETVLLGKMVYDAKNREVKLYAVGSENSLKIFYLDISEDSKEFEVFISNLKTEIEKNGSFTPVPSGENREVTVTFQ